MDSNFVHCYLCDKTCNEDNPPYKIDILYVCEKCYENLLKRIGE